jgi:hypothetical protein
MRAWVWIVPVTLGLLLASPASRAEERDTGGHIEVVQEAPEPLVSALKAELRGATVGQAFRLLEQALGARVQFLVNPGTRDIPLPGVTLKDTNAIGLMNLLANLVPDLRIRVGLPDGGFNPLMDTMIALSQVEKPEDALGHARGTRVVLVDLSPEDKGGSTIERKLRIYRLADLKPIVDKAMTVDDLATAIESVWEVDPIPHVATLKFHKETNLLICFGTARHLALVDQVLEGISGRGMEHAQAERLAELEADTEKLRKAVSTLMSARETQSQSLNTLTMQFGVLMQQVREVQSALAKAAPSGAGPK